ncbi:MAG: choline dehydrogenase, partial [Halieaceae bacterium]
MANRFDYIIVGGGSAGCVLANRLSQDRAVTVLLLEAGGSGRSIFVDMPSAFAIPMASKEFNWGFYSKPEPGLDGRSMDAARGRGLGGSSAINGMVYVRGHPADFDDWESLGAAGWNYENCLPYFQRAETWMHGADDYRGGDGPIGTCNGNNRRNPLYQAFIDAGAEAGYGLTEDYNGYRQEGFGPMHMTVKDGIRSSTRRGYLEAARSRPNLTVVTRAEVESVGLDGSQARSVSYWRHGSRHVMSANKEIILSAGSIGSPSILQRSGIGPSDVLERANVDMVHELSGVGENLTDHLEVYFQYRCKEPITLNGGLDLVSKLKIGARWFFTKTGLGASNHFESCGFIRTRPGVPWPDIQYHFLPGAVRYDGNAAFDGHGFQVHVGPNKPESRGHVRIRSGDIREAPQIVFNYLATEKDREDWRICLRLTREILSQP